jgi:hypothetical protein
MLGGSDEGQCGSGQTDVVHTTSSSTEAPGHHVVDADHKYGIQEPNILPRLALAAQAQLSLFSNSDLVNQLYVTFEILQLFENKPLGLARWVTTLYLSLRISSFKVNVFNVIHHRH